MNFKIHTDFISALFQVLLLNALFLLSSCTTPTDSSPGISHDNKYFDLKGYLDVEIERLGKKNSFTKIAHINGKSEEKTVTALNLENELKPFYDSDINKPAWSDKYTTDSLFNQDQQLTGLTYTSTDEKLRTQQLSVSFKDNEVSGLMIKNATNSSVAQTSQTLNYIPARGFSIESIQYVSMLDKGQFKVEVKF